MIILLKSFKKLSQQNHWTRDVKKQKMFTISFKRQMMKSTSRKRAVQCLLFQWHGLSSGSCTQTLTNLCTKTTIWWKMKKSKFLSLFKLAAKIKQIDIFYCSLIKLIQKQLSILTQRFWPLPWDDRTFGTVESVTASPQRSRSSQRVH